MTAPRWALIVHGGAKEIDAEKHEVHRQGCRIAAEAGRAVLERGGPAVEAVEAAIRVLEDDPTFNAGRGSVLNEDGFVEMDAALMDGRGLDIGAVAAVRQVRHPISIARRLLDERPILIAGDGARRFAERQGLELCSDDDLMVPQRQRSVEHDTVGCVALDVNGNIAAGTSTGGLEGTFVGRIGDCPLPGCGFYAENDIGGVSLSGDGETIARTMVAAQVMRHLESEAPDAAVAAALRRLETIDGEAGIITIDAHGRVGWGHNSPHFAVGIVTADMNEPRAWVQKDEEPTSHG